MRDIDKWDFTLCIGEYDTKEEAERRLVEMKDYHQWVREPFIDNTEDNKWGIFGNYKSKYLTKQKPDLMQIMN